MDTKPLTTEERWKIALLWAVDETAFTPWMANSQAFSWRGEDGLGESQQDWFYLPPPAAEHPFPEIFNYYLLLMPFWRFCLPWALEIIV